MALAVVTSFFNPAGFRSNVVRYDKFKRGIEAAGVPLFTVELAFGDQPFALAPSPQTLQVRTADVLWHKERILNLLISGLPGNIDKVAWLDADVLFAAPDWPGRLDRVLEEYPIAQAFETAILLPAGHDTYQGQGRRYHGISYAVARKLPRCDQFGVGHPGFAWAARRELLAAHGLYDRFITGSGDGFIAIGCYAWKHHPLLRQVNGPTLAHFLNWANRFWNDVKGRVGSIDGQLLHLWHGEMADRKYQERMAILTKNGYDPEADIAVGPDGCWSWATDKPGLHAAVRAYFAARREDG